MQGTPFGLSAGYEALQKGRWQIYFTPMWLITTGGRSGNLATNSS